MTDLPGFILTLVSASAASALTEGLLPDGGMKKYVKYLAALVILALLLSPFASLAAELPAFSADMLDYDAIEAMARVNAIVAMHMERAVCEKFDLPDGDVSVEYEDGAVTVRARAKFGLLADDIAHFTANRFGVSAEVILYE